MTRVLIVSDTHGNNDNLRAAVKKAGKIDLAFHAGDIHCRPSEIETITRVPTYVVRGNNDYDPNMHNEIITYVGTHKVMMVHGHRHNAYMGLQTLWYTAQRYECDIIIFGHTHVPVIDEGDVTIINPGSLTLPRQIGHAKTFIIMEIDDDGNVTYTLDNI